MLENITTLLMYALWLVIIVLCIIFPWTGAATIATFWKFLIEFTGVWNLFQYATNIPIIIDVVKDTFKKNTEE